MVLLVLVTQNLILSIRILQNLEKKLAYNTKNHAKMSLIFGVPLQQVWTVSSIFEIPDFIITSNPRYSVFGVQDLF